MLCWIKFRLSLHIRIKLVMQNMESLIIFSILWMSPMESGNYIFKKQISYFLKYSIILSIDPISRNCSIRIWGRLRVIMRPFKLKLRKKLMLYPTWPNSILKFFKIWSKSYWRFDHLYNLCQVNNRCL